MSLLEVRDLTVGVEGSPADLLRNVSFSLDAGQILGLVGESGSGKTMACLALMGLLPSSMELRGGSIRLGGRELIANDGSIDRSATDMTMVFQQPRSALNPTMKVGRQIARIYRIHRGLSKGDAEAAAIEMLRHVGIPGASRVAKAYPHQLSGGMCQRVMIAMALACRPRVLIADEPTTALDVTIQAQIFDLIEALVSETNCGVIFITHDLAAVSELCDDVAVLYAGQVMEQGPKTAVLNAPTHPYTRFLLDAVTRRVDPRVEEQGVDFTLAGCRFAHRCPHAMQRCNVFPPPVEVGRDHIATCVLVGQTETTDVSS